MSQRPFEPQKITTPIQLLAVWLLGLVLVEGSFVGAAVAVSDPVWLRVVFGIAAVVAVPTFLVLVFVLQTKFRPEMQADSFYSTYLARVAETGKSPQPFQETEQLRIQILRLETTALTMLQETKSQLSEVAARVKDLTTEPSHIQELGRVIQRSDAGVKEVIQRAKWTGLGVEVNDLLPRYLEIRRKLEDADIPISRTFGSSSEPGGVPETFVLTFGNQVSPRNIQTMVELVTEFGLEYISHSKVYISIGRVYVGSYIFRFPEMLRGPNNAMKKLDSVLLAKLRKPGLDSAELYSLLAKPSEGD